MTQKSHAKSEKEIGLWFGKRHKWQIFIRTLESVKIGILMGFFCPKQKMHELKIYRGVTCNDTEE